MIRVDNMESYKELRESGYAGDILVLMKGGNSNGKDGKETDGKDTGKETDGKEDKTDNATETDGLQFDYEKII